MRLTLILPLLFALSLGLAACGDDGSSNQYDSSKDADSTAAATGGEPDASGQPTAPDSGLQIIDLQVGDGATAEAGRTISVHYTGWLEDGTKFDSSLDRGQPFEFVLGVGDVIEGWDRGVEGMKVGGKRRLVIPPELAYGEAGRGSIPPNATLTFEVELLDVR
ncbi:MAG: hypothetical protein A2148_02115 [Chloroflexi bacterium RBG_16_68_14]|nr:MAG: hypothetical protein A2148_02115 [Chloroflexi bacterium RBG_16_68_14]